jgi:hypothetical protein
VSRLPSTNSLTPDANRTSQQPFQQQPKQSPSATIGAFPPSSQNVHSLIQLIPGIKNDRFVVDIPFPTEVPQWSKPIATAPPARVTPVSNPDTDSPPPHEKRGVIHLEKRGFKEFLSQNKFYMVSGAVIFGGGLWFWDRFMRLRNEKAKAKVAGIEAIQFDVQCVEKDDGGYDTSNISNATIAEREAASPTKPIG